MESQTEGAIRFTKSSLSPTVLYQVIVKNKCSYYFLPVISHVIQTWLVQSQITIYVNHYNKNFPSLFFSRYIKKSSPNQMKRMLERIERQKYKKLAAVKIEEIEKVIKELEKPEESRTIIKILEKLYEVSVIKRTAAKTEFNKLAKCLNISLRIQSKKTILNIADYIRDGKNLKIEPVDSSYLKI